ncbi:MAG TPA: gluconate 2-dehydrogenase subunit 3 family protein [Chthoniobacterales bacterium]|nr:gluconate 2-dehydrogenase subunit 3 family protein [Chthoniobacterales bacterium]
MPNDKQQSDRDRLPLDEHTLQPLEPRAQPGYYPGFSTLGQQTFWDAATREVIRKRVHEIPPIRFFNAAEARFMQIICDHLLPQDDRDAAHRIPILPYIDERLHLGKTPGYRFESMPPDGAAYRLGMQAIEQMSKANFERHFLALAWRKQEELLKSIHDAKPLPGAEEIWKRMPIHRYFALVLQDCVEMYYAHPWAWDEIGFGGPAYPRAYTRLERGEPEPWEVEEQRYEWVMRPEVWVSDPKEKEIAAHSGLPVAGQGGSH